MTPKPGKPRPRRPIDWDEVHRAIARQGDGVGDGRDPAGRARAVLEERAKALARVPERPPDASEVVEVATFRLASECYALETQYVRRVERLAPVTPVPGTPDHLAGVVNLNGEILAVFDLRVLFGIARGSATDRTRLIVVGDDRDEFGILADSAEEVVSLRNADLFASPGAGEGYGRLGLRGTTRDALIVLDGETLLLDERLVINPSEVPGV